MKILYSQSTFIFASISPISWKISVWTTLFKKFGFSIRKEVPYQHYGKIPYQEFKSWSAKYLKLKVKSKSWYIHDLFKPVSNNSNSSFPFNTAVIDCFDILIFSLITVLAFHKDVSSILISTLQTCVFFIIFFSVSKPKCNISEKILIENQLAIKTNQPTDS